MILQVREQEAGIMFLRPTTRPKENSFPNLHKKRFYIPEQDTWITLKVSSTALRTINKNGINAVLRKARANGNTLV